MRSLIPPRDYGSKEGSSAACATNLVSLNLTFDYIENLMYSSKKNIDIEKLLTLVNIIIIKTR